MRNWPTSANCTSEVPDLLVLECSVNLQQSQVDLFILGYHAG